jgi:tetrahydromethanopterin S-methyltransferase subunit E
MLLFALTHQDWHRFSNKAMTGRAVVYPVALAIVPVVWFVIRRWTRHAPAYPGLTDLLFSLPWLIDVAGNAADAFDQISWFDDAAHFVNWALLAGALATVLPASLNRWIVVALCVGLGCVAALGWEIGEYYTFVRGGAEEATAYGDTLFDLTLGTAGALLAGITAAITRR